MNLSSHPLKRQRTSKTYGELIIDNCSYETNDPLKKQRFTAKCRSPMKKIVCLQNISIVKVLDLIKNHKGIIFYISLETQLLKIYRFYLQTLIVLMVFFLRRWRTSSNQFHNSPPPRNEKKEQGSFIIF